MPIFQKRIQSLNKATFALGDRISLEVTREFHIEGFVLEVGATVTAEAATTCQDNFAAIVKRFNVSTNDGQNNRNVVSMSGPAMLENFANESGILDRDTRSAIAGGLDDVAPCRAYFPIYFAPPQMQDPTKSAFLLPAPRFNTNIQVTVDIANLADLDTNASPELAISGGYVRLHVIRRVVTIPSWVTYDQEIKELTKEFTSTGDSQILELDTPGSYTNIILRLYANATPTNRLSPLQFLGANGQVKLQALDTSFQTLTEGFTNYNQEISKTGLTINGFTQRALGMSSTGQSSIVFDFLTDGLGSSVVDLGSVLNSNAYVATGSRIKILCDVATAANVKMVTRRLFGDLSPFMYTTKSKG